jgi:hypothetical protein
MFSGSILAFIAELYGRHVPDAAAFAPLSIGAVLVAAACLALVRFSRRPLWPKCSSCGKATASNIPWVCGVCGHRNETLTIWFSFLHCCRACHAQPIGFKCRTCAKDLFAGDGDMALLAYATSDCAPRRTDPWEVEEQKYVTRRKRLTHRTHIAVLQRDLAAISRPPDQPSQDTLETKIQSMEQTCLNFGSLAAAMKRCRATLDQLELSDAEKDRLMARLRAKSLEKS